MNSTRESYSLADLLQEIPVRATLTLLEGAYRSAVLLGRSPWDFAVTDAELHKLGVTHGHLEALIAAHVLETRTDREPLLLEGYACGAAPRFPQAATCFVLSRSGAELIARVPQRSGKLLPHWDAFQRVLWLGDQQVLRFRRAAENQEYVLRRLQEDQWEGSVEIAWPDLTSKQSAQRLRQTIKSLNRGQVPQRLCFRVEGGGKSVRWQVGE